MSIGSVCMLLVWNILECAIKHNIFKARALATPPRLKLVVVVVAGLCALATPPRPKVGMVAGLCAEFHAEPIFNINNMILL